jgi:NADPH-dependent 7-cyano-7-deazaguanine reductase QueF
MHIVIHLHVKCINRMNLEMFSFSFRTHCSLHQFFNDYIFKTVVN